MPSITLTALESFLASHPSIRLVTQSSPDFEATNLYYIRQPNRLPFAIVRPQNAEDVSALIKYCIAHKVDFVVRSGGHDCAGRSQVKDALTIDIRDIKHVEVAADKKTARVGGGVLARHLAGQLRDQGLLTTMPMPGTVGWVGWALFGGYGQLSGSLGMGCDQIVAAKVVNPQGEVIDADADLLRAIRGAGPAFGVVVEATIKVYPIKQVLEASIILESTTDFEGTLRSVWNQFGKWYDAGIPPELAIQLLVWPIPGLGNSIMLMAMWSSPDFEEGRQWIDKLASLGTPIDKTVRETDMEAFLIRNDTLINYGSYGMNRSVQVRGFTPKVIDVISKYTTNLPGQGAGFCMHLLKGRGAEPNEHSVFHPRQPHMLLELISNTFEENTVQVALDWSKAFRDDVLTSAAEDVVGQGYVALLSNEESDFKKLYGANYEWLVQLKRKLDPQTVFKNTIPQL